MDPQPDAGSTGRPRRFARQIQRFMSPLRLRGRFTLWALMWSPSLEPFERPDNRRGVQMARYFRASPQRESKRVASLLGWLAACSMLGALVLVLLGEFLLASPFLVGGVIAWWNGFDLMKAYEEEYHLSQPKPSEEDIDRFLQADLTKAAARALSRSGLTAQQVDRAIHRAIPDGRAGAVTYLQPPMAYGPVHDEKTDLPVILGYRPRRFRAHNVLVLCPTDHHLVFYRCRLNLITGGIGKEEVREIYPRDITLMSMVDKAPDVGFFARHDDGTPIGTTIEKVRLRELTIGRTGGGDSNLVVMLTPGPELDGFLEVLRGLIRAHKQITPVRVVPQPLPVRIVS